MSLKKKPKHKDIKYINSTTMEVECTYNQCFKKFVQKTKYKVNVPSWNNFKPIKFLYAFHECPDCKRTVQNKEDNYQSIENYQSSIYGEASINTPELTPEEISYVNKFIKDKKEYGKYLNKGILPSWESDSAYNKRFKK
jgi:S-adenosylmethionine synthetase